MRLLLVLAMLAAVFSTRAGSVKVACVGDSITQGIGTTDPMLRSYPAVLGKLLGPGYKVENFGYSGATLLKAGNNPYWKTPAFRDATRFDPKIVVIALGTNDSKTINWDGREAQFRSDYEALIMHFATLPAKPKIFLCLPPPSFQRGDDIRERILVRQRSIISQIVSDMKLTLVDLDAPLRAHRNWFADGVHPNELGANAIATAVCQALRK